MRINAINNGKRTHFKFENKDDELLLKLKEKEILSFSKDIDNSEIKIGLEFEFYLEDDVFEKFIKAIGNYVDEIVYCPDEYNIQDKDLSIWTIERDGTLNPKKNGFEIVSPKLDLAEAQFYMKKVLEIIRQYGHTDNSCGLHFHISSEKLQKIDPVKLMLFNDNKKTLDTWKYRSDCNFDISDLFNRTKPSEFKKHFTDLSRFYTVASRSKYGLSNHLEVRAIGGLDYEKKEKIILDDFKSFVDSYHIACDPMQKSEIYYDLMNNFLENKKNSFIDALTFDEVLETAKKLVDIDALDKFDLKETLESIMSETEDKQLGLVPAKKILKEIDDFVENFNCQQDL